MGDSYETIMLLRLLGSNFITHFVVLFVEVMRKTLQLVFESLGGFHVMPNSWNFLIFLHRIAVNDNN